MGFVKFRVSDLVKFRSFKNVNEATVHTVLVHLNHFFFLYLYFLMAGSKVQSMSPHRGP